MALITVLMPVYNGIAYLAEAVDAIKAQTLTDWRLLVVDDGSTDGSGEYIESLRDSKIDLLALEHVGLGAALNAGLELCQSPFIARMDCDDICHPMRFERQLQFLEANPDVGVVGTQFRYFGERGEVPFSRQMPLEHDRIVSELREGRLALVHASLMFRRSVLESVGGYRVRGVGEDWDLFLRICETSRVANLPESLYRWRLHPNSVCRARVHETVRRIRYACDCARKRRDGLEEWSFDRYCAREDALPFWRRTIQSLDEYALEQYRESMAEIAGDRPFVGRLRLGWSGCCSPTRGVDRVLRACAAGLASIT
jgi:glycosyltransferase involved in cell wall biosynthesis